jgi:hypothetical protein
MATKKTKKKKKRAVGPPGAPVAEPSRSQGGLEKEAPDTARSHDAPAPETQPRTSEVPTTKPSERPPEVAHDDREIDVNAIVKVSMGIAALTLLSLAVAAVMARWLSAEANAGRAPPPVPPGVEIPTAPPDPKLQPDPYAGLRALRAEEKATLDSYGWVDEKNGVARIPIERAIDILSARGLPARVQGPPDVAPVSQPTEGSLGARGGRR